MLTGHQLAKVANTKLIDAGFDTIPPQMVYNYMKQGRIEFVVTEEGKKRITVEAARTWLENFLTEKRTASNGMADLLKEFEDIS